MFCMAKPLMATFESNVYLRFNGHFPGKPGLDCFFLLSFLLPLVLEENVSGQAT